MLNKKLYIVLAMLAILAIFTGTSAAVDTTPPDSITNLHVASFGKDYILWQWNDPGTPDFDHVDTYINGVLKTSVPKGVGQYNATGLTPYTIYKISTHTVDANGNVNQTWKNSTKRTAADGSVINSATGGIRFITIGDPHMSSNPASDQYIRLSTAVNYVNGRVKDKKDVDFVVVMGDSSSFGPSKTILDQLSVPYYSVAGNHDLKTGTLTKFESIFGPAQRVLNINGYQLVFIGIKGTPDVYQWQFDFNNKLIDKTKPTLIFDHGPVQPKPGGRSGTCSDWGSYFGYACSMKPEIDKFTHLLAFYSGHTHVGTAQTIKGVLYTTEDNLGGYGPDSDYIGYTKIIGDAVEYATVKYN